MKRNAFTLITLVAAVVFAAGLFNNFTSASEGNGSRALEGTWRVRLTPRSGTPQFDEFMTFTSGGGIVESNNFTFSQLGLSAGPGHGTWEHAGAHTYRFAFSKFLFQLSGLPAGTLKAAGVLTYSPETRTWSGPANVSLCDNLGQNCFQIDTTDGSATRMPAE